MTRRLWSWALATALLSTVWLWPHLLHPRKVPDRGDPVFSAWRIARLTHQATHDPSHLFDGNIFYPRRWTMAYSDATLLQSALGAPLVLANVDPLIVANTLFFLSFPLCGLAFFLAGWQLTRDPAAALVAGLLGAWYPFRAEHYSHLELQWFMFAPLAVVCLLRLIEEPRSRRAVLLAALIALQCLASMYLALMLVTVLVVVAVVRLAFVAPRQWKGLMTSTAIVGALLLPIVAALAIPYLKARADHGERPIEDVQKGSALPADYLHTTPRLATYRWHERAENRPERELFPGTSTLVLAAVGTLSAPVAIAVPLAAGAVAAFDWSLGLNGASYRALVAVASPFRSIRVPARYSVILGTLLILLGAVGARAILTRAGPRYRPFVLAALAVFVLCDLRLTSPLVDYYPRDAGVHERLTATDVVAAFPIGREIDYMYASTRHWEQNIIGYSGFMPMAPEVLDALAAFPDADAMDHLATRGVTHVLYVCAFERSITRCATNTAALDANPRLELIAAQQWMDAPTRLYRLVGSR